MLTVFTSLASSPGALLTATDHGWLRQGYVKTVLPVPRGDHLPFLGSPVLPPLRLTGGFCHADWTVPRQDVNSPFSAACATRPDRCLHTRRFGTLAGPPPPVDRMPWGPPFCWPRSWVSWRKMQRSPCSHRPFSFHW